jgi:hypothetical protein
VRLTGAIQHFRDRFLRARGEFEDEDAGESMALQFTQDPWPVDVPFPRRQVVIAVAPVVIDMDHVDVVENIFEGAAVEAAGKYTLFGPHTNPWLAGGSQIWSGLLV